MASAAKLARSNGSGADAETLRIDPAIKAWIDRVIVPALVKAYIREEALEKYLAPPAGTGAQSRAVADLSRGE